MKDVNKYRVYRMQRKHTYNRCTGFQGLRLYQYYCAAAAEAVIQAKCPSKFSTNCKCIPRKSEKENELMHSLLQLWSYWETQAVELFLLSGAVKPVQKKGSAVKPQKNENQVENMLVSHISLRKVMSPYHSAQIWCCRLLFSLINV